MDFYTVHSKITKDKWDEEIYTEKDDETLFESDVCLAIVDSCGFSVKQAKLIYDEAYQESHSFGLSAVASNARYQAELIRKIVNMEDDK